MAGFPFKPLSPGTHRRFDQFAAPGLLVGAILMARHDRTAAALMAVIGAGEGAVMLTTNYPPPVLSPLLSFRQHIAVANLHAGFIAALAMFVPGVQRRHRPLLLGLAGVPLLLNALSDVAEKERAARS